MHSRQRSRSPNGTLSRAVNSELDLHGFTVQESDAALKIFLEGARERREQVVRVITGNGHHSPDGMPRLRLAMVKKFKFMQRNRSILTFALEGGHGAFLVTLPKGESKKK